jgi:hypothetical protein
MARALDATSATRAMPRTSYQPVPAGPATDYPATAPPPDRRERREAARTRRRRRMASLFALLLVLAAIAAVGLAVVASQDNGGGVTAPDSDQVEQQLQELRELIQEQTR